MSSHPLQKTMSRARSRRIVLPPVQEHIIKIEDVIDTGDYYGAQQMYKSVSARYVAAERYSEALDILQSGACTQLKLEQITCGSELAVLFVETLVKGKVPYDDNTLDRVRKIYKNFPQIPLPQHLGEDDDMQQLSEALGAAKTRVEGCSSFLKAALKWSMEFGSQRSGSPEIHIMLATYIYSESPEVDMTRVSYHFVRGDNPKKFASTLVNFMGKCYPGEDDMAIARAVLMYLSLGNLRDANVLFDELKKEEEREELELPDSDLIEFIVYLLLTLQRDALPLFNMLRVNYKSSLEREPALNELLDEIAEKFYGVRRRNPLQGIFGDFLKMMG
ncbi:protein GET4 [Cucumis melo]|uniref:Golgi to ER traffic protein 4 homolog isoform X1 n=1 Tax=Cucumis melo TaxID=3656 RepID=A0A1S3CAY3_CUCME|nr:protein GET4 [Cucumis melo]